MDDRELARFVREVERTFPGDPAAQRDAWEFIETFLDTGDAAGATDAATTVAGVGDDRPAAVWRLLGACRELLRDTTGRVAGVLDELVPADPAVVMNRPPEASSVELDADAAAELGLDPEIAVEAGADFVALSAEVDASSTPERLAAVIVTAERPDAPDGEVIVRRFARLLDPTVAAVNVEIAPTSGPLALALVVLDPDDG